MQRTILVILTILFVYACTSNTIYKKPDDLIDEDVMVELIVDIHLASAAKSAKNNYGKYGVNYMPLIYEKYKIDSARFVRSSFYYASDIDVETKLLKRVQSRIEQLKNKNAELVEIQDSLEQAKKDAAKKKNDAQKTMISDSIVL